MRITWSIDNNHLNVQMDNVVKQSKYGLALGVQAAAAKSKETIISGLSSKFTIRRKWIEQGIRNRNPTYKDEYPTAHVFVMPNDRFMYWQEFGGVEQAPRANQSGKVQNQNIPVHARENKSNIVPKRLWAGSLLKQAKKFVYIYAKGEGKNTDRFGNVMRGGPKVKGVYKILGTWSHRSGAGKKRGVRMTRQQRNANDKRTLMIMYRMKKSIKYKPVFGFFQTINDTTHRMIADAVADGLIKAFQTAKATT